MTTTWRVRHVPHGRVRAVDALLFRGYAEFYKWPTTDEHQRPDGDWIHIDAHGRGAARRPVDEPGTRSALHGDRTPPRWVRPLRGVLSGYLDDLFVARVSEAARAQWTRCSQRSTALAIDRDWAVVRWTTADDNYRARAVYDKLATRTTWITYDMTPTP